MIRDYTNKDVEAIIKLFDLHTKLTEAEAESKRKELEAGAKVLVYQDDDEVKGICSLTFWNHPELGSCAEIIMSAEAGPGFKERAEALWEHAQAPLKEKAVVYLITNYNQSQVHWQEFYSDKGLEKWFSLHGMIYKGEAFAETNLTVRNYEASDFDTYHTIMGECFSPMREANDIKPYNTFKDVTPEKAEKMKKAALEMKDNIYMFYDDEKFVGSSMLQDEEIDDLFVVPDYQGQGYGRKIMEATLNLAMQKNLAKITLGVVAWNTQAVKLYTSLGFEIYQTFEFNRARSWR